MLPFSRFRRTRAAAGLVELGLDCEAGQSVVPRALQHFAERAEGLAAGAVDTIAMLGPSFYEPGFEQGFEL